MNEKVKDFFKISHFWLVVGAVLLVWAVCGTISAILYHGEYKSAVATIEAAGGDEFVKLISQHNDTAIGVHDDIVATRIELQSAVRRTAELEQRILRAYEYAKSTDEEFIEFRSAMGSAGTSIQDTIRFQQGIIDFVGRIERNNSAIKVELGVRP